jgi:2-dehydropantoate 2-reductase
VSEKFDFAIFGCGAIGGAIGAYATRAGRKVLMIEPWAEHAAKMQRDGLIVQAPDEEWTQAVTVISPADLERTVTEPLDVVVVSVKSMDTVTATQTIEPFLSSNGCVVSAQNSINEELIAPIVGSHRTVGCVVLIAGGLEAPGLVQRRAMSIEPDGTSLLLGELDGTLSGRLTDLQSLFEGFGPVGVTSNLLGARWGKLTRNSMHNTLAAVSNMGVKEILSDTFARSVHNFTGIEIIRVVDALNIPIEHLEVVDELRRAAAGDLEPLDSRMAANGAAMKGRGPTSTLQDALKGRPLETDYFNGYIARKAKTAGVEVPLNEMLVSLARQIDDKTLNPSPHNLPLFKEIMAGYLG